MLPRISAIILSLTALALYTASLFTPLMVVQQLYVFSDTVTFVGIIRSLAQSKEWLLCIVIVIATIILPFIKFFLLAVQIAYWKAGSQKTFLYQCLIQLSRWSMLDVFVIAVFIVMLKTSFIASARTAPGFYYFISSIVLIWIAGMLVQTRTVKSVSVRDP